MCFLCSHVQEKSSIYCKCILLLFLVSSAGENPLQVAFFGAYLKSNYVFIVYEKDIYKRKNIFAWLTSKTCCNNVDECVVRIR